MQNAQFKSIKANDYIHLKNMSKYEPSALEAFFVFNPLLGGELTEARKILSFHPKEYDFEAQKALVGLVEGLVNFTYDFSPDKPAEALHTNKRRYAFLECEKDYFIVLAVQNPMLILPGSSSSASKDRVRYTENELEDSVLQAIIKHAYTTFKFFNGHMGSIAEKSGVDVLKRRIKLFMDFYIPTIRFSQLRFFTDINGFRFFPVDKTTYLAVQYLANLISTTFPRLQKLSAMYNSRLIWSGIEQEDMRVLYNLDQDNMNKGLYTYLAKCQFEEVCPPETSKPTEPSPSPSPSPKATRRRGRSSSAARKIKSMFLTGPLRPGIHTQNCPKVYLTTNPEIPARLVVYRYQKLTLFWIYYDEEYDEDIRKQDLENEQQRQKELAEQENAQKGKNSESSDVSEKLPSDNSESREPGAGDAENPQSDKSVEPENPPKLETVKKIESDSKIEHSEDLDNSSSREISKSDRIKYKNSEVDKKTDFDDLSIPAKIRISERAPIRKGKSSPESLHPKEKVNVKDLCAKLEQFMLPKIKKLCLTLETQSQRLKDQDEPFRFLYFNHCNLALKTSLNSSGTPLSLETIQILRTIHVDFSKPTNIAREVCVKTSQDGWVVGRKSEESQREFYILVDDKKAPTLPDLKAEIDALETTYFGNIFIL